MRGNIQGVKQGGKKEQDAGERYAGERSTSAQPQSAVMIKKCRTPKVNKESAHLRHVPMCRCTYVPRPAGTVWVERLRTNKQYG